MLKNIRSRSRGQVLLMTTMMLLPMFGVLGLVTDLGYMHYVKMTAQTAAEAAANSAIIYFQKNVGGSSSSCGSGTGSGAVICSTSQTYCGSITSPGNAIEAGCAYAKQHGFDSTTTGFSSSNTAVTYTSGVNSRPTTASGVASASYWVTFYAYQKVPQFFSAVLGNTTGLVVARSSAGLLGANDCIYAMNKNQSGTITVSGNAGLHSACGVFDNSTAGDALNTNGCGNGTGLYAPEYDVVGGVQGCSLSPSPNTGVSQITDPLAYLTVPASAPYTCTTGLTDMGRINTGTAGSPTQLYPGTYCGGINIGNGYVNLNAGTYILVGGGLTTQSTNSHITGTNVMIYNTYGTNTSTTSPRTYSPIAIDANSTVSLKAATTGTYAGILFFEDRSAPASSDTYGGGSTAVYEGVIYALKASLSLYGNSSTNTKYTLIVADTIRLVGTTSYINNDYSSLPSGGSPIVRTVTYE